MSAAIDPHSVAPAFGDAVSGAQETFRHVLEAMAHPGRVVTLGHDAMSPKPLSRAATAVALTLFDFETRVWLDAAAVAGDAFDYLRFHCGCPITDDPASADFAIADAAAVPPLDRFAQGTDEFPDRSTTLIIDVAGLSAGTGVCLTGPGIKEKARLSVDGLPAWFWDSWSLNHGGFPLGVDVILTHENRVAALPRTVHAGR